MSYKNIKRAICACVFLFILLHTSVRADYINALYGEIETLLLQRDGAALLKEKSSAVSQELAAAILGDDLEKVGKAAFLMRYADPAPNWDVAVANLLSSEGSEKAAAGLSILEVHGLLGSETKGEVTNLIADPPSTAILSGAATIAGRASLTEVLPLLRKELWSNDIERNAAAIRGLIEFGPDASYLISDLERKLRQIGEKPRGATETENYLSYIPRADKTEVLKGLLEKAIIALTPVSTAKGSDFVEYPKQHIETTSPQTAEQPTEEESAEVVAIEPVSDPVEKSSNWLLWLIGALVVIGGVFVLRSRK